MLSDTFFHLDRRELALLLLDVDLFHCERPSDEEQQHLADFLVLRSQAQHV